MTQTPPRAPRGGAGAALVAGQTLIDLSRHSAARYYLSVPGKERPVFQGVFDTSEVAPGVVAHRVDIRDLQGAAVRAELKPGLRLALTIGGRADVSIGHCRLPRGPQGGDGVQGALVAVAAPATFARQSRRGDIERTVSLAFSHDWLARRLGADGAALAAFAQRHLAMHCWPASAQAITLAEQMLRPPALAPALWRLYLESRALDLLVEGFDGLEAGAGAAPQAGRGGLARRDFLRMARIRELLESGEADAWSLEELARHACLSVNTLQRHFRAAWGMTVFECLRGAHLTRARLGLERDGLSVAQAACLAGYTSAANFATAFRRAFGVTPGQLRARR